jgi:hypothetical protein
MVNDHSDPCSTSHRWGNRREGDRRSDKRPLVEGGEGWAEGFEGAEEQLERNASHEDRGANPMRDAGEDEKDAGSTYGEADHSGAQGDDP